MKEIPYWKRPGAPPGAMGDREWGPSTCQRCGETFYTCDSYLRLCPPCEKGWNEKVGVIETALRDYLDYIGESKTTLRRGHSPAGGHYIDYEIRVDLWKDPEPGTLEARIKEYQEAQKELRRRIALVNEAKKLLDKAVDE